MTRFAPDTLAEPDATGPAERGAAEVPVKQYLLASDFDQTLSFHDSGEVLGELLGRHGFRQKVDGLAAAHLVQQGGELAYLLLHDPEYRCVRRSTWRKWAAASGSRRTSRPW